MNKNKILPIVIVIFLFALSPLVISNVSAVSKSSSVAAAKNPAAGLDLRAMTPAQRAQVFFPNANGKDPAPVSTIGKINPTDNKVCPSDKSCTVVADGIGAIQVYLDGATPKLIASLFIPTNSSNPYTCPESTVTISSSEVLVLDACLADDAGGAWVFNPQTLTFSTTQWTNLGSYAYFGAVSGGDVFFANFDYGTFTVYTTSDSYVNEFSSCGYYPEFFATSKTGTLFVGDQEGYDSSTGYDAGCVESITSSGVTASIYGDATNGPGAYYETSGIGIVGNTVVVNSPYTYNSSEDYDGAVFFTQASLSSWSSSNVAAPNSYILWQSAMTSNAVWPISVYTYNINTYEFSEQGFTFPVWSNHGVGSEYLLGGAPEFTCASGQKNTNEFPNEEGGSSAFPSLLTQISHSGVTTNVYGFGYVYPYGCSST